MEIEKSNVGAGGLLKRFISYYKPHKLMFSLDMAASMLISLLGMIYPVMTNRMLNDYIPNKAYRSIIIAGLSVLVLYVARMFLRYFVQYQGHMVGTYMQAQMRTELFVHLEKLPFSFFDDHETGAIMTRMTNDLFEVSELAHHGPENLLTSSVMIILSFVYLCTINVPLTLMIFACVPILIYVSGHYRRKMREAFNERRKSNAVINASLESSITGVRVTKAYTNADRELEKFEVGNKMFTKASALSYKAMGKFHSSTSFVTEVFNVIILIAGGLYLYSGKINFGEYSTFIVSVNLFISPVQTLIGFMEQWQNGATGFRRFIEIMDVEEEKDDPDAVDIGKVDGEIELRDVCFSYTEDDEKGVLDHISLKIEKGTKMALVGPSGGGKTTICHLIPNFYKLEDGSGEILVDGKNIKKVTMESLRKNIGIVQQDVFLFSGTIRDNIRYGCPDATEEEIISASKRANMHEFVLTLPDGYDTEIGERGIKLSGGQKQRISIARVFLKNPAILILDEATSALDNSTEVLIQRSLDELCEGRTTLVVAHRLSTIRNADKIAVVTEGKIAEFGTHAELIEKGGIYKDLYDLQFRNIN
ncbi:MAG: ABC transporter ATP-binding protein [Ruminococcaceae bacterium]|jgi:ATP-binding cassette subfamily B protein|nr:ABC transporter ATP-binding protein [Oscillospiraceae bacterium]